MALAGRGLGGHGNRNKPVEFALFPAPSERRPKHNEFAACGRWLDRLGLILRPSIELLNTPLNVLFAGCGRDRRGGLVAKELDELIDGAADQIRSSRSRAVVFTIVGKNIGDQDLGWMAIAEL